MKAILAPGYNGLHWTTGPLGSLEDCFAGCGVGQAFPWDVERARHGNHVHLAGGDVAGNLGEPGAVEGDARGAFAAGDVVGAHGGGGLAGGGAAFLVVYAPGVDRLMAEIASGRAAAAVRAATASRN